MQGTIIIPARFASTRFPGKPLAPILGVPMIVHVVRRCTRVPGIERVLVATDDHRIAEAIRSEGGEVIMTSPDCPSGTDRVAEAASGMSSPWFINVQGDEPLIPPENIARVARALAEGRPMVTLDFPLEPSRAEDPSIVKVVTSAAREALYFSRAPIPYPRTPGTFFKHIGIYGYRRDILERLVTLPPCPLEITEGLEQLRALYHGIPIYVERAVEDSLAVDEPDHVAQVEARLRNKEE
ncbi:MAG TPA: 3-deoxy-manno-octulosonate cytidylyltransferase [Thermoanaerobaculia bacterium]|nr:3-deoxy-manno-octulosonate cytidylyltransferase [Thermoanaerobaculia bacterium]HUM30344.1 3-deoxy-manno-octulosonate cytidylyltransferase [Thermoanaerobaculia bacterium]HXK68505.1 3-deoxy-manno-octulosonate cytidylyltransferase [Thermoanaerobaculia bacterium]